MKWSPFAAIFVILPALQALGEPSQEQLRSSLLNTASFVQHLPIGGISFTTSTKLNFDPKYLAENPKKKKYEGNLTRYEGLFAADKFKITAAITENTGEKIPNFFASYDGKIFAYLDPVGTRNLVTSKKIGSSSFAMRLGSALLLPYAFAFETLDDSIPYITLSRLKEGGDLGHALQISELKETDITREFSVEYPSGDYHVTISKQSGFPLGFTKYSKEGTIIERYSVRTPGVVNVGGVAIYAPKEALFESFAMGKLREKITIRLEDLKFTATPVDPSEFEFNFSEADTIWDADENVQVSVPK
jgi:hypothetical protein